MLRYNSFRAQRYLRSRFVEGKYLLASEGSDLELELIDFSRKLVQTTLGNIAVDAGWKVSLFRIQTKVTGKTGNILTVDSSLLDLANLGDKVFKAGDFEADITNVNVGLSQITVTDASGISIGNDIEIQTSTSLLVAAGEAWFNGLPYAMRSGDDQLVSGSTLAAGIVIVPGGGSPNITMQDDPMGRGKIVTFNDGGTTPTAEYTIVISAREQVITNIEDPFIKNVNIPESTGQKVRLTYRINVVPTASIDTTPVPYTDSTIDGNLTNYVDITPQTLGNGSEVSRSVITGSGGIDGRNLEITIRNNAGASNPSYSGSPVGNLIPNGASEQQEYSNGRFIDSLGQEYWLNAVFNDVVANQVILRLDKEVGQTDPEIINGLPYRLVKRDVYVTDDTSGSPLGQLFWSVATADWDSTDGFVHETKVTDLRNTVESLKEHEEKTTIKFNLRLLGGGIVTAEPSVKSTGSITVINNTFDGGDAVIVNGVAFTNGAEWAPGGSTAATATNIAIAITSSTDPLIENVVTAVAVDSVINITAVIGGTAGDAITLAETDGATDNFTLSGATLTGGVDGTPGELAWTDDFKIVNPHNVTQLILAGEQVIREGGAIAYFMDLENGGVISKGQLAVTTTSNGTVLSLSGSPDLSKVKRGNTIVVDQDSTTITEIDDNNKTITVSPALTPTGSGVIYLDTFGAGTLPLDSNTFVLAVKTGDIIQVTGRGELEPGESTSSGVPIQLLQYIGSPSETDNTPDYTSNYVVNDGDDLTKAIGKLDAAQESSDLFTGKTSPSDTNPQYPNNNVVTDGQPLVDAIGSLDQAVSDVADYVGAGINDVSPVYGSTNYITDGDPLVEAISDLDFELGIIDGDLNSLYDYVRQDRNAKLIKGGTWAWDEPNNELSWSSAAFIQIPGLADSVNQIAAGTATLGADGRFAYVSMNRAGPGGLLSVQVDTIGTATLGDDDIVIARRVGNDILIGASFLLKSGEFLEMDGALAEINRRLNQLRLTEHESAVNKARIAAADITQLDSTILTQELSDFILNFSGAVINFTTGDILASDDATPLGINFTPFTIPVGQYFWYGVGLLPATVGGDNRISAQVLVTPASAANAVQASAPYPNILGDKKLGAIQIQNVAGTMTIVQVRRLGVGSGSGSGGTGDTTEILETVKNMLSDSIYSLAAQTVFKIDEEELVDPSSTGAYSIVDKAFALDTAETLVTQPLLDQEEFKDLEKSLPQIDLSVFWKELAIDDAATYEISRDGGTNWQTVTMERVGQATSVYQGTHTFTDETDDIYSSDTTPSGIYALNASTQQAGAIEFTVTGSDLVQLQSVIMSFAKVNTPTGTAFIKIVKEDTGAPSTDPDDIVATLNGIDITSISVGANTFDISAVLGPGTYYVVIETDSVYKSGFPTNVLQLTTTASSTLYSYNGSSWSAAGLGGYLVVNALVLDLRLRITASQAAQLEGFAVLYDVEPGEAPNFSDTLSLLEANHLGSTNQAIDRSVAGRGIFLRRPDGTLRELVINDNDDIEIWSVD